MRKKKLKKILKQVTEKINILQDEIKTEEAAVKQEEALTKELDTLEKKEREAAEGLYKQVFIIENSEVRLIEISKEIADLKEKQVYDSKEQVLELVVTKERAIKETERQEKTTREELNRLQNTFSYCRKKRNNMNSTKSISRN